jgi:hypothetical protein
MWRKLYISQIGYQILLFVAILVKMSPSEALSLGEIWGLYMPVFKVVPLHVPYAIREQLAVVNKIYIKKKILSFEMKK